MDLGHQIWRFTTWYSNMAIDNPPFSSIHFHQSMIFPVNSEHLDFPLLIGTLAYVLRHIENYCRNHQGFTDPWLILLGCKFPQLWSGYVAPCCPSAPGVAGHQEVPGSQSWGSPKAGWKMGMETMAWAPLPTYSMYAYIMKCVHVYRYNHNDD